MDNLFSQHLTMGFRRDGRRPYEIRKINCKLSLVSNANGSAQFTIGNTSVIASVYGPQHPKNRESRQNRNESTIIVRCTSASFSSTSHKETSRNYRSDRLLANTIKSTFDSIVMKHLYPRCTIEIVIEILQNDGGHMSAAINAVTLALIDSGIGLNEYCVSVCAGYIDGSNIPLLDLNYFEKTGTQNYKVRKFQSRKVLQTKSRAKPNKMVRKLKEMERDSNANEDIDMEVNERDIEEKEGSAYCSGQLMLAVMPVSNKIITMQMQSIIDIDKMEKLLQICQKGCKDVHKVMKSAIKKHSFQLMQHRGFINR